MVVFKKPFPGFLGSFNAINDTLKRLAALVTAYHWSFTPQPSCQNGFRGCKASGSSLASPKISTLPTHGLFRPGLALTCKTFNFGPFNPLTF